jgi:uncharacterized membrane protein (DUF2068 family)
LTGRLHSPPGTAGPRRYLPRLHWELLVCGTRGHELVGTDVRELTPEDAIVAREGRDGERWYRCPRCDSWLPLPPPEAPTREHLPPREEIELPLRGKALRDKVVLRLIAINRAFHFLVLALLAAAVLLFAAHRSELRGTFYRVVTDLQGGVAGGPVQTRPTGITHELDRLFTLSTGSLHLLGAVLAVYALVEGIEAVGLWYQRRWAEYLTFLVTASLLPLDGYELVHRTTALKITAVVINIAVVVYLLVAKRLFGIRGGAAADEEERARDVGWEALERTAPGALQPSASRNP